LRELLLHPLQMSDERRVAGLLVRRLQDRLHFFEGHAEIT
jgi:hypothetical protein